MLVSGEYLVEVVIWGATEDPIGSKGGLGGEQEAQEEAGREPLGEGPESGGVSIGSHGGGWHHGDLQYRT